MTCTRCGTALPESAVFCSACGAPTGRSSEAAAPPADPPPSYAPPSSSPFDERTLEPGPAPPPPTAPSWSPPPPPAPPPAWTPPPAAAPPAPQWGGASAPAQVAYAGFWRRFAAWILDGILLNLVGALIAFPLGVNPWGDFELGPGYFGSLLANLVIAWLYSAFMESSTMQATVGQLALSIKVTDMDGGRIGFGRATGRHFAQILSALILCIGYLMIAFTEKKQALHDMIAGCLLVKRTT